MTEYGVLDLDNPQRVPIDVTHYVNPNDVLTDILAALAMGD